MAITVEDASIKQLDRLYEIEKECFNKEAFTKQQIAHLLTDYNSIGLLAKEKEEIVGFIIGTIQAEKNSLVGHIVTIDVSKAHQRRGLGAELLQQIEKIFRAKGVNECHLEAREDNVAALNLYQKLGYIKVGRLRNYYGDAHGTHLRKTLAKP
jgi:ribosomal-protein-alanine N-acetyltransferase